MNGARSAEQLDLVRTGPLGGSLVPQRAFLVALDWPGGSGWEAEASLEELTRLADTAGIRVVGQTLQRRSRPDPATFLGRGKAQEVARQAKQQDCDALICDDELAPAQHRNLERLLELRVMDRTELILAIFAQRATSREAHLQVELARLDYLLPRLAGAWRHLERQRGGIGTRGGPGEQQIELDRRQVRARASAVRRELEAVRARRKRARSRRTGGPPLVALVGYTNAGKSTLMRRLTQADVLVENKLFATLDPTTRRMALPGGASGLLSDTVGFIQKLPPQLVAAFRATLEELAEADLLLHVVDVASDRAADQAMAVYDMLEELGLGDKPVLSVLNKADLLNGRALPEAERGPLVSALNGAGLDRLRREIAAELGAEALDVEVRVPYEDAELAALFRREALSLRWERFEPDGISLRGRLPLRALAPFRRANAVRSVRARRRNRLASGDTSSAITT